MLGVQAEGAAPVTAAFRTGEPLRPVEPNTLADSIAVGTPRNWKKAVIAVRESAGAMVNVSDEEIMDAMRSTGQLAGVFAEPAAAAAVAGLKRGVAEGIIPRQASALAIITGNGLKDIKSAIRAVSGPLEVTPDLGQLSDLLTERGLISQTAVS
jgi:threonine synthase